MSPHHATVLAWEAKAAHHPRHYAATEALHHLAHFDILLQKTVDFLHGTAAAACDALAPAAVQDVVMGTLLGSHRVDDCLDMDQFFLVHLHVAEPAQRSHVRQHAEDLLERSHLADLPQLIAEIFEREFIVPDLLRHFDGLCLIDGLFGFLDQGQHVSHPEDAARNTIRIKWFQGFGLFAGSDELDGLACRVFDRERGAATGIAVHLGQDYPR